MNQYIAAIDQGTTSSRCMIFDHDGAVVSVAQKEHEQIFPRAGWVEHDPAALWINTREVVAGALAKVDLTRADIAAVGITNQRETTVVWERSTGEPIYNAIVWQDTRTDQLCVELGGDEGPDKYRDKTGLPLSTYFAGPKIRWILDNVDGAKAKAEAGELCFGTVDTWIVWNLTEGVHVTDVTNASRTMLMDLETLQWDESICADFGIPMSMLPEIRSSSEVYGTGRPRGNLAGVPVAGILGDQQAATFGQACLSEGEAKNTYGTGNFMLLNTGTKPVHSKHGLLTTVCYKLGEAPAVYALEGSVAVTGSLVQWLRDNLGIIQNAKDIEPLAASVDDNGGAYFVPAFSGLFAPRWRPDARGVIVGLTRFVNKGHLARAALEATAYQTREVIDAMRADSGVELSALKVDGGMVVNETLMQFQSDILGVPVIRPVVNETTALGAAYAAGLAIGYWADTEDIRNNWAVGQTWEPAMDESERSRLYAEWNKAVERTYNWSE
ncbi:MULTISPECIES: glycerol kinase GlpK [Rhodococcus]|uniref:glycerol kinase GlpK n=1 Tax=Rhodococcus TaxID=1827 RepID=UPI000718046E|nr:MULTISPECIES: glycerol kinase GlpK [Rhodococcus]ANQ73017.1 glycerol kinase [Rhodococcus sp. 008]KZL31031.1 glycerol kinase [Rhodococcus qingshengii]MBQ9055967.1 glycerol kinase GlpK [Rhodococcus sp. (in: high G+C Gram-positive bacteria)]MCE4164408.1 glycerol kinase GlpK [Rhodococcus sp. Ni2]ORC25371.1 glycerol kinase [Rhodococcus qingshengii]